MPQLEVLCDYVNPPWGYALRTGEVIEVSEEEARRLKADSPGTFEEVTPKARASAVKAKAKALKEPPANKQIVEPAEAKSTEAGDSTHANGRSDAEEGQSE